MFFFFEMLDFKNRNIGGKEKENGLRKNFNVGRLCYFFTDVKKKRIIIELLLADSRIEKKSNFFINARKKKVLEKKTKIVLLLFFSSPFFFPFFIQQTDPVTRDERGTFFQFGWNSNLFSSMRRFLEKHP